MSLTKRVRAPNDADVAKQTFRCGDRPVRPRHHAGREVTYHSYIPSRLSGQLETQLFRITQEALTNVGRHSGASHASISLTVAARKVRLSVEDNGRGWKGPRPRQQPSLGMVGVRARARQVHGEGESGGLGVAVDAPAALAADTTDEQDSSRVS